MRAARATQGCGGGCMDMTAATAEAAAGWQGKAPAERMLYRGLERWVRRVGLRSGGGLAGGVAGSAGPVLLCSIVVAWPARVRQGAPGQKATPTVTGAAPALLSRPSTRR